jgi:p-hydroxybenzoate 3-monooxygenase
MRTQVGIVGAGPAGLLLSHLLHARGIDSVVLERRSRDYVEARVRAGVLEQGTVDLLGELGVDERLRREGLVHHGLELRFGGRGHRIDLSGLTGGRAITIYGQQEVVKDLIAARLDAGGDLRFEVEDVRVDGIAGDAPAIAFREGGHAEELRCDVVAGCDGSHGVCRPSIPAGVLRVYERDYPFGWLGILAEVAPSTDELIYCFHEERGFALHSLRSHELSRLYVQVDPADDIAGWSDRREGPVLEKGITAMRSFVAEPMRYGRLFLTGDAAHIVPPTGAKGLNLAVADVARLAEALGDFFASGTEAGLDDYSDAALRRVWRAQHFSWFMTSMLHKFPGDDPYQVKLQLSQLRYTASSPAAATSLAENYVGLPRV